MSYVCYYKCDKCGTKADGDLTPPGWLLTDDRDLCRECRKHEVSPSPSEDQ